jgi:membrane-associated phospholipid phosphatase
MTSTSQEVGRRHGSLWGKALVILLAWACLTGILIAVGVWVTHSSSVNGFDRHVTSVVVAHRTPVLDSVMKALTWLGSWVALVATGILLVVLVVRRRLPIAAVLLAAVAWAGESGGVTLAKHIVHRSRPPQDVRLVSAHGWSWPSGHTAVAIVVFTTLALVVTALVQSPVYRAFAWALGALAVFAVAFSRVELGVHWSTDVIASTIFVAAWLMVFATVFASEIHPKNMHPTRASPAQGRDDA